MTKISKEPIIENLPQLPESWKWAQMSDIGAPEKNAIVDGPFGSNLKVSDYVETGPVPVLTTKNLYGDYSNVRYITQNKFEELKRSEVRPNDILMAKIGSCGKTGIYPVKMPSAIIPANLMKITVHPEVEQKYVYYYFDSLQFQKHLRTITKATAQPAFGITNFKKLPFPLAPPEQQKRIVAKIEELFSHIDAGIEALKKAKQLLKQYRQSVLKAAVTGELTKEWREANKAKLEPASQLLGRILKERRQKWEEQQLEQFKAKGKMPKNDKWKEKYEDPELPDTQNSEVIPESWLYCGIEMLLPPDRAAMKTGPFGSLLKKHEHKTEGIPVLGIENIASMQFVPGSKIHITMEKAKELDGYKVIKGDILISRSGTVGEVCVVPDMGEARISTNLMKLSLIKGGLNPVFFTYLFNGSPFVLGQVKELCKGSTRDFLNQDILKKLLLVLPSYQEQIEIMAQVEERFYKIDRLDKDINRQMLKAEKNKQSVLASAFVGGIQG